MTTAENMQTRIKTNVDGQYVCVDEFGDELWLSINVIGGNSRCILSYAQARQLVAAINRVFSTLEEK